MTNQEPEWLREIREKVEDIRPTYKRNGMWGVWKDRERLLDYVDRLRGAIEWSDHDRKCNSVDEFGDESGRTCNCWKSKALAWKPEGIE